MGWNDSDPKIEAGNDGIPRIVSGEVVQYWKAMPHLLQF
jgi:hypothetical protein